MSEQATYKPHTYAPTDGWPVPRNRIDGPASECECGYYFVPDGETQCVLCRELPGWQGEIDPEDGTHERDPRDFAWCWVCGKPFLHNDLFPENGDESGVFPCETCVEAKLQSGEWRECEECHVLYERDQECRHSVEAGDPSDSENPGSPDDPREQCVRCDEWLLPGQLDGFGHCPDCREEVEGDDE